MDGRRLILGIEGGRGCSAAMDWLRAVTVVSLMAVGVVAGGSVVRLALVALDPQAGIAMVLVGLVVLAVAIVGARTRRWRYNPYW